MVDAIGANKDLSSSRIYAFFNDSVYGVKWGWLLEYIKSVDGTTHPTRQAVAIQGNGTNGDFVLYHADQLSHSIANFFNRAHAVGGYTAINFTAPTNDHRYNNVATYNNRVFVNYSSYQFTKTGNSIFLPPADLYEGYTITAFMDGATPHTPNTSFTVNAKKALTVSKTANAYDLIFYDDDDEILEFGDTYTIEAAYSLPTYVKPGFVFLGWYDNPEFTGSPITSIPKGSIGHREFFAKTDSNIVESDIVYNLNSGGFYRYNSRNAMVDYFLVDFNAFTGLSTTRANFYDVTYHTTITYVNNFFADSTQSTKWGWMKTYIIDTGAATSYAGQASLTGNNNSFWRSNVWAFINITHRTGWPASIDFTVGTRAHDFWSHLSITPTTTYIEGTSHTLEIPLRVGFTFGGWYDNSEFTGDDITAIVPSDTGTQTFYAKWNAE